MRAWRTPDGEILLEGPVDEVVVEGGPVRTEAGEPVVAPHRYYLIDAGGTTIKQVFGSTLSSVEYSLYGAVCKVDGDTLYEYWTESNGDRRQITSWRDEEITGLVRLPDADGSTVGTALAEFQDRQRKPERERQRSFGELSARFTAALPDYPGDGPVDLVFGYDEGPLVREPGGRVLWRLTEEWLYRGKDLHGFLRKLLESRYGDRLGSFATDLDAAPWWFWAPDL